MAPGSWSSSLNIFFELRTSYELIKEVKTTAFVSSLTKHIVDTEINQNCILAGILSCKYLDVSPANLGDL